MWQKPFRGHLGRFVLVCLAAAAVVLLVHPGLVQANDPSSGVDDRVTGPTSASHGAVPDYSSSSVSSGEPVWYDFYVVGLKTDNGGIYLGVDQQNVQPETITEAQVRARVEQVDQYFSANTNGTVRARLVRFLPFEPFPLDVCKNGALAARQEAERRAGLAPSSTTVVVTATTTRCPGVGGIASGPVGSVGILLLGYLNFQTIGHEFGHSHLWLDHESYSTCGDADALTSCPDYLQHSFDAYWGTSLMASSEPRVDPLLPTDLARMGLLNAGNTVVFRDPPVQPVDIEIGRLPLSGGIQVIELGSSTKPFYISMSPSTNIIDVAPVVQVTQLPDAFIFFGRTQGLTIVSEAGKSVAVGRTRCGESGFCMEVLSRSNDKAVIRISKRTSELPTPPTNLRASTTPAGRIQLDWDSPGVGPEIRGFDVQYIDHLDEFPTTKTDHVTASSWELPVSYGSYKVRVAADTSNGTSAFTPYIIADNRAVPEALRPVVYPGTLGKAGLGGICDGRGYAVEERRYFYTDDPSQPIERWLISTTGQLAGLATHRQYTVKGQCRNVAGWGPVGGTASFTLSDVPRQPAMTRWDVFYGPDGLRFRADHNTANPWGDPETGIKVSLSPGGASCENHQGYGGNGGIGTACTISGLPPGQAYTARIVLTSPIGESAPQYLPVGTAVLPPPPTNLKVMLDSMNRATLSWDPVQGLYENPAVTYRVTLDDVTVCSTATTRCALPAMTGGVLHVLEVFAATVAGESLPEMELYEPPVSTVDPPGPSPGSGAGGAGDEPTKPQDATNPSLRSQTLKRLPRKAVVRKRIGLPATTQQRSRITWSSRTPRTCRVKALKLVLGRPGECRVVATAAATADFAALQRTYRIKIRTPRG